MKNSSWHEVRNMTIEERFWRHVEKRGEEECWPWNGYKQPNGYGMFEFRGKKISTHRFACELRHGPIEDGLYALHSCDNKACCNPMHLRPGTPKENSQDSVNRGRTRKGDSHPSRLKPETRPRGQNHSKAKITETDVRWIRDLRMAGLDLRRLSDMFGVNRQSISMICKRQTWSHV